MTDARSSGGYKAARNPQGAPDERACYGWPRACDHVGDLACMEAMEAERAAECRHELFTVDPDTLDWQCCDCTTGGNDA